MFSSSSFTIWLYNPGPSLKNISTPDELKVRSGLGILHLDVRSLLPKIDTVKILVQTTEPDILVLSETWLSKSIEGSDVSFANDSFDMN